MNSAALVLAYCECLLFCNGERSQTGLVKVSSQICTVGFFDFPVPDLWTPTGFGSDQYISQKLHTQYAILFNLLERQILRKTAFANSHCNFYVMQLIKFPQISNKWVPTHVARSNTVFI